MSMTTSPKPCTYTWHRSEQPRQRLLQCGAEQLLAKELVALCLGSGVRGEDALSIAARLLEQFGSISALIGASSERLLTCHGLGAAKVATLKAVHEIACRVDEEQLAKAPALNDVDAVTRYIRRRIGHREREIFGCLFLDTRYRLLRWEELFLGSLNRAHVHSREILKRSMELNAAALVLGHNHPSGVPEPSQADINLTLELKDLLARIDIAVLDHIIVTPSGGGVSLANRGLMGG